MKKTTQPALLYGTNKLISSDSKAPTQNNCAPMNTIGNFRHALLGLSLTVLLSACGDSSDIDESDFIGLSSPTTSSQPDTDNAGFLGSETSTADNTDTTTDENAGGDTGGIVTGLNASGNAVVIPSTETGTTDVVAETPAPVEVPADLTADTPVEPEPLAPVEQNVNSLGSGTTGNVATNNPDPIASLPAIVLAPLPQTQGSPAPDASDEPIPVSSARSTASGYALVRDGGPRIVQTNASGFTQADFDRGLPEPRVIVPGNVNPNDNPAPFFEGLSNRTIFAGETLNLVLAPKDSDGTFPGQFPEKTPPGSQYIDNFDSTRTLRWTPLQPDVGIHEMKFTAVDGREPQYRAEYTVLIQVLLPDDQSGIENFGPGINTLFLHTAQVNDPVVIEIKGTDPNGTVPDLEINNQPPGATFTPHESDPNVRVLRFVPTNTGLISLNVIAYDQFDRSKTARTNIDIDVRPADNFLRDGPRLRDMADNRGLRIGYGGLIDVYYRPDGALYSRIAADEFNFITPENSMKWGYINPQPGRFRWAAADNLVTFADTNNMEVHGHTLVWYTQIPSWIQNSKVEDRELHMREFIDRMLTRYGDKVPVWDVVNEAFEDNGDYRNSVWFEAMGAAHIEIAFRQARESAPNATLLYNEYDVSWNGPKSTAMFNMLQALKDRQVPIDGVGFQMHIFAAFDQFDEVEANFQKAANMDLDIYITELDVSMADGQTVEQQAEVYRRIMDICLRQPRCKSYQTWGFTDQYSWRRQFNPLLLDKAYQPKPAFRAIQQRLTEN